MNKIWVVFARMALAALKKALKNLPDSKIKEVSDKINQKIDIPVISEEIEGKFICGVLHASVEVTEELLNLVKL
jgi:hypothetical protein